MSSAEEDFNHGDNLPTHLESKRRRIQRACDTCHRRKSDGSPMQGNRCSSCIASSLECTYVNAARKRPPSIKYVESLEDRVEKMESFLRKNCPDVDISREFGGGPMKQDSTQRANARASGPGTDHVTAINATSSSRKASPNIDELGSSDDEDSTRVKLSNRFLSSVSLNPLQTRFYGKSSGVSLLQKAIDLKKEVTGSQPLPRFLQHPEKPCNLWELVPRTFEEHEYIFPEEDLGRTLVDLYFTHVNSLLPFLHRPSFERNIQHKVHLRNTYFGAVYLLVCAVASRFSDDPRVFLDDVDASDREQSSGWKYFQQVCIGRRAVLGTPCLEDLQIYTLTVLFLQGTSAAQGCWTIVGIGIRIAQDVGAHRRKSYGDKPTVERELWKRAFWALVMLDRQLSTSLGRPCAIQTEDIDLDFPIECDDEYWEHPDPEQAFKQPPGKPSNVCFFTQYIKLNDIMSFAARTIYSINKSKILLGFVGQRWEQHIVSELDSSLNKWIDEVPDHLRWDPTRDANSPFFMQSTALYAVYYTIQIFVHRPFIPSPRKPSPLSFPSLAICTNAARSCSHVIDIYRKRSGGTTFFLQTHAFTAGTVLLLNIWGGKRSGLSTDPLKEMADVHKCMAALKQCGDRWHTACRLRDILYELASAGDLPLPQPSPQGTKRGRDPQSPTLQSSPSFDPCDPCKAALTIPITSQVGEPPQSHQCPERQPMTLSPELQKYHLPVYSNDLGRLPVHGQVDFSLQGSSNAPTTTSFPDPIDLSNMFPPLSDGTDQQHPPSSHAPPMSTPDFTIPSTFSFDELFNDPISTPFDGYATPPAPVPTGSGPSHAPTFPQDELHAFLDATIAAEGVQTSTLHELNGMLDLDTMAMWSGAPTGFEVNDWGAFLSNVVQQPRADESASSSTLLP